jgi:hypothetical protein
MLPGEIVDGGGRLVVDVTVRLRGRDGIEVKVRGGHVQVWDQGLLRQYALFQSLDEAKSKGA